MFRVCFDVDTTQVAREVDQVMMLGYAYAAVITVVVIAYWVSFDLIFLTGECHANYTKHAHSKIRRMIRRAARSIPNVRRLHCPLL